MERVAKHQWASGGVSGYPLTHPIVGQGDFFRQFAHFMRLVEHDAEGFVQVFTIIAQWGIGKSRLGYELVAQINNTSRGWYVRGADGALSAARLFGDDAERDRYLGLYIRYSQISNDYQNVDNWFAFGLYKALLPMARGESDHSIQRSIARESIDRLLVKGFDHTRLAEALEVDKGHSDEKLFEDPTLVTRLCEQAYAYLKTLGIAYAVVVLDELETAAEAATYGLEEQDMKYLDGRAIKMIGTAIKEEDPRRKLPWLRYVALCSPAIGHELREIQSTARRFELMELQQNAFADVSDFVKRLREDGALERDYPAGLIEAAYAMSGGNFGWFNVIMANVDQVLRDDPGLADNVGGLFLETVHRSNRVRNHVLDHTALEHVQIARERKEAVRDLLFGQLPRPLSQWPADCAEALLAARNEYDEPVAALLQKVQWSESDAAQALRDGRFVRDQERWRLQGITEPLDLRQLLANLGTYAIHETHGLPPANGVHTLLIPLRERAFLELVAMLYPHPAAQDAARTLWRRLIGSTDRPGEEGTHLGPSMEMLGRLDLRLRTQSQTALIFRSPEENVQHDRAMALKRNQPDAGRCRQILTGCMRLLDDNWDYDAADPGLKGDLIAIQTPNQQLAKGLLNADFLKLHPEGRLLIAYVRNLDELGRVCDQAAEQFRKLGRTPVLALTPSRALLDQFSAVTEAKLSRAPSYLLLHQLSTGEEHFLQQIGLPKAEWQGFQINRQRFSTSLDGRLQALLRGLKDAVTQWRRQLDEWGFIAWPWRSSGKLRQGDQELLTRAWVALALEKRGNSLADLDEKSGVNAEGVVQVLEKMEITPKARTAGYGAGERARLFEPLNEVAQAVFPPFLCRIAGALIKSHRDWSLVLARQEWFWGYAWEGNSVSDTYQEWMGLLCAAGIACETGTGTSTRDKRYAPVTLANLRGNYDTARGWLRDDLPKISATMQAVYGEGRIQQLFASLTAPNGAGTQVIKADALLQEADRLLDETDHLQDNCTPDYLAVGQDAETLRAVAAKRVRTSECVRWVFEKSGYDSLPAASSARTLSLEDENVPLWERVGKGISFAEFVQGVRKLVDERVNHLQVELSKRCADLEGFPAMVFTRALEKIKSIFATAADGGVIAEGAATWNVQARNYGSLTMHLRSLRLGEAAAQMERMALEIGIVDLERRTVEDLDSIKGHILPTYRELRGRYEELVKQLGAHEQALQELGTILSDMPEAFGYPAGVPKLAVLRTQPGEIMAELKEAIFDELEALIEANENAMRLGNFQPLMEECRKLYEPARMASGRLGGHTITLQNAIRGFRERLLADSPVGAVTGALNRLRQAKGLSPLPEITVRDVERVEPLAETGKRLAALAGTRQDEGEKMLAATGVSFERWRVIVRTLDSEGMLELELAPSEDECLVSNGFLVKTYEFGRASA